MHETVSALSFDQGPVIEAVVVLVDDDPVARLDFPHQEEP